MKLSKKLQSERKRKMQPLTIAEIVKATGGTLICGDEDFKIDYITTDSRKANAGLFVPLAGESFDGHMFLESAFSNGADAAVTEKDFDGGKNVIKVTDTYAAIRDIAEFYKEKYPIKTVSVIGSVGKTTTKDMISGVLQTEKNTQKTQGNFNNHLGVPITVFTVEAEHEVLVLEMGMSNFGEISALAKIGKPDIAVMTNIGTSHIENLGSQENIYKAKTEVLENFTKDNLLIANGDDKFLCHAGELGEFKTLYYGIDNPKNDCFAKDINNLGIDGVEFTICYEGSELRARVMTPGIHNVYNALAAFCVGKAMGLSDENIILGLKNCQMTKMRLEIEEVRGMKIIKDYYNAAPDSIRASLTVLADCEGKRKVAVLGDVLEMGEFAKKAHTDLGDAVLKNKTDVLITAGTNARYIAERAKELGLSEVFSFDTTDEAAVFVKDYIKAGDAVLIKASHGMKFEKIYEGLK